MTTIRPAHHDDLDAIRAVMLSLGRDEPDTGADERYVEFLMRTGAVLVADDGGAVAGWVALHRGPLGELLSDLFVRPDRHGQGLGRRLVAGAWPDDHAERRYTFSSQHPHALPVYAAAGLLPRWPLLYVRVDTARLQRTGGLRVETVDPGIAAEREAELSPAASSREADYRYWSATGARTILITDGGHLVAAGAIRPAEVVHLACPDRRHAAEAVLAALRSCEGAVDLCLPGPHPCVRPLLDRGARITDFDLAMSSESLELPETWVYAPGLS